MLSGDRGDFTIRAAGDLTVLRLAREHFLNLLEKNPALKRYSYRCISDSNLRHFIKQCSVFSHLSPEQMRDFLDAFIPMDFELYTEVVREGDEGDSM